MLHLACAPASWTRAGHLFREKYSANTRELRCLFRQHCQRAPCCIFFIETDPTCHIVLCLVWGSPCFGWVVWNGQYYQLHSWLSRFCGLQRLKHSENRPQSTLSVPSRLFCARLGTWREHLRGCPPPCGLPLYAAALSTPSTKAADMVGE